MKNLYCVLSLDDVKNPEDGMMVFCKGILYVYDKKMKSYYPITVRVEKRCRLYDSRTGEFLGEKDYSNAGLKEEYEDMLVLIKEKDRGLYI